jgi:hypothetical protein
VTTNPGSLRDLLRDVRGGAPRRSPTVRVLAAFADHGDCNLATLAFAAGVDTDRLLAKTDYEAPFGQSPFAFARGLAFERMIGAASNYGPTLRLLRENMGFPVTDARVVNLRDSYPRNSAGMRLRAHDTRALLSQILHGDHDAPNLIDGAVLETRVGGVPARFEADALAARVGGLLHAGEVKSFPVVDGRAEPDKLAAALDQVAIYILLAKQEVVALGGDPDLVSTQAMLITPRNVGLTPTLSVIDVARRVTRAERLLSRVPAALDLATAVPTGAGFGPVADNKADPARRVEAFHDLADRVGNTYKPTTCMSCGVVRLCRMRAFTTGAPSLAGAQAVRLLPGIRSLDRAAELADGAPSGTGEAPAAAQLARAGRLYDQTIRPLVATAPTGSARRRRPSA